MSLKSILVVDDEQILRELLRRILSAEGHFVDTAADGLEALERIEARPFDLVLTDLMMPGMRGDELAHEIKQRRPDQRVVLLTAFPPDFPTVDCDQMLPKPFSLAELRSAVAGTEAHTVPNLASQHSALPPA